MKSYTAAIAAMLVSSIAAATCSFKVSTYNTPTDCTGTADEIFTFENINIGIGSTATKAGAESRWVQVLMCDADLGVTYVWYSDEAATTLVQRQTVCNQMVCGFRTGNCFAGTFASGTGSYKLEDVKLSGNKFGVGWLEGWGVFFCSAFLFGLCWNENASIHWDEKMTLIAL